MITKTFVTALTLALTPMAALAQDRASCDKAHANCAEGTTYDEATKTCLVVSS